LIINQFGKYMRKQYPKFYFSSLIFASGANMDVHASIYTKSPRSAIRQNADDSGLFAKHLLS